MKVIIADDEVKICTLIQNLVNWEKLGLELIGVYQNGRDVLERFAAEPADILICDIEMPIMSGLELIEQVSGRYPRTKCVIISGFRNFEYAHQAMKYGVTRYVLKPIDPEELNEALAGLVAESERGVLREQTKRQALWSLLEGQKTERSIEDVNRNYGYKFADGCFNVIKIMLPAGGEELDRPEQTKELLLSFVVPRLRMLCYDLELFPASGNCEYIILNYEDTDDRRAALDSLYYDAIANLHGATMQNTYICVGEEQRDIARLSSSLVAVNIASGQRLIQKHGAVLYANAGDGARGQSHTLLTSDERRRFLNLVETIDAAALSAWIRECFRAREGELTGHPHLYFALAREMMGNLFNTFYHLDVTVEDREERAREAYRLFESAMSLSELEEQVERVVTEEVRTRLGGRKSNSSAYVQAAKTYIERHHSEKIGLEVIADELGLNPSYLSTLFKTETGINYSQYLTNVRMERAKELLRGSELNLSQIAVEVGYQNAFYFGRIFLKEAGVKPQEYRRLHQSDE